MRSFNFYLACAALFFNTTALAQSNLVVNGDFEVGSFLGWSQGGDMGSSLVGVNAYYGIYQSYLGQNSSDGFLSQVVATTPGTNYLISFFLNIPPSPASYGDDHITASFGGGNLTASYANSDHTHNYSFQATASSLSSVLSFSFINHSVFWQIDNVSVTAVTAAVPEPLEYRLLILGLTVLGLWSCVAKSAERLNRGEQ